MWSSHKYSLYFRTAQSCPAIGVFLWVICDQKAFIEPDSRWLTLGGTKCSAGYFGGRRIKKVDFKIAVIEVCNIIGERGLISPEEDRVSQRKRIHDCHWWASILSKDRDALASLFPLLLIIEILNTQGLRAAEEVAASCWFQKPD